MATVAIIEATQSQRLVSAPTTLLTLAFGHGLSYTSFEYSQAEVHGSLDESDLSAQVKVTNTGATAGREVVQIYVQSPDSTAAVRTLEGFAKTSLLQPGVSQVVSVALSRRSFSKWDTSSNSWKVQAGTYDLAVAKSAEQVIANLQHSIAGMQWTGLY